MSNVAPEGLVVYTVTSASGHDCPLGCWGVTWRRAFCRAGQGSSRWRLPSRKVTRVPYNLANLIGMALFVALVLFLLRRRKDEEE